MQYFDIHSHLYFKDFDSDRVEVISRMKEKGIYTVSIGTGLETSKEAIKLAEEYDNLFASVGFHPAHFKEFKSSTTSEVGEDLKLDFWEEFKELVKNPKVVCIGECGFDYFRLEGDLDMAKKIQTEIFEKQVRLAIENQKALMLHCRASSGSMDAYIDTLNVLKKYKKEFGDKLFGNAHFFAGNQEVLKEFLDLDFSVSFTGVITFVKDYNELVKYVPIESIHAETDAPFVSPQPFRGKRNSPEYVTEVVKKIAEIKGIEVEVLKNNLISNAKNLFKI